MACTLSTLASNRGIDAFETSPVCGFGEVSMLPPPFDSGEKRALGEAGADLAINYPRLGVAPDLPCSTGRGGARNRADRESYALTLPQIANLTAAERHAEAIGLPFTRFTTIHWEGAGVPLSGMVRATGRYIDLLTKALARRSCRTAWIWVLENGEGKGGHCHLLVHIPAGLVGDVTALQRRWLRSITGNAYRSGVIRSVPIGGRLGLEASHPELHAVNREAALAYLLKGADAEAAKRFGLERLEPGGRIIGRRCSTSQNIGAKARGERN